MSLEIRFGRGLPWHFLLAFGVNRPTRSDWRIEIVRGRLRVGRRLWYWFAEASEWRSCRV